MSDHSRTRQGYAQLYLLGAFALRDSSGTDRTPKNKKAQAILAMLALSPRGTRTRAWLRNKLWSNSDEHHASSSLRQTLFELKKAFGPYTTDFIEFDRQSVSLQLDRIWVDVRVLTDNPGGMPARGQVLNLDLEFLEGMDINDEEFEDWLMMERAAWEARLDKLKEQDSFSEEKELKSKISFRHRPRQIGIGLLPCITHGKNPDIHP
ncbi:MAG: hypothetical protein IE937_12115, partial [Gammaproteobacteria bacterium]|nr:hypothetical protein [Gammaproteobacteria bacterium]